MSDREKGWIRTMIEELNSRIEKNSPQMVESLSEIVRIPSKYGEPKEGAPYGEASRQALKFAMDLGRKLGFETVVNVDDRVCYIEYGTGSKVVGVFTHLDVVPEGDGWTYPPFGGEIHNNRVYGRGTIKAPSLLPFMPFMPLRNADCPLGITASASWAGPMRKRAWMT